MSLGPKNFRTRDYENCLIGYLCVFLVSWKQMLHIIWNWIPYDTTTSKVYEAARETPLGTLSINVFFSHWLLLYLQPQHDLNMIDRIFRGSKPRWRCRTYLVSKFWWCLQLLILRTSLSNWYKGNLSRLGASITSLAVVILLRRCPLG